jgi:RNA polymerase sigma-70 factor (ECF subfamily)
MTTDDRLNNIFMTTRNSLMRLVSRLVPPREIEDIVQETYVRVCQIENKESIQQPRAFLLKTAKNLAIDYLKRSEVRLADSSDGQPELLEQAFYDGRDTVYQQAVSDQEFSSFCEAVRLLPQQSRKVFVLKKVYGYTQKEIANELNLSQSTVEKHIALGIKRCTYFMMKNAENSLPTTNASQHHFPQRDTVGSKHHE